MATKSDLLKGILYPAVRVRAKDAGGSGTVLWSGKVGDEYKTFVLTNHHVVSNLIKVEDKYDPFLGRKLPSETRGTAQVEFFRYARGSRLEGTFTVIADIVTYDESEDLALLELRTGTEADHVAKLALPGWEKDIHMLDQVYAVGAALGHPPIVTSGRINHMDDEIDDKEFWMSDAQIIFGNSGGAVYLQNTLEFIGVPSRIAVAQIGWSGDAITHMGYFIPFARVWEWLDSQFYNFIYDDSFTYEECAEKREEEQEAQRRALDVQRSQDISG